MNITDFSKRVKTFKKKDIVSSLQTIQVGARDLSDNLTRMAAVVDIATASEQWVLTKGIAQRARKAGVIPSSYVLQDLLEFNALTVYKLSDFLIKEVNKYDSIWDGKLLTVRQANILNMIEYLSFWVDYTNGVLEVLITLSTDKGVNPESVVTKDFYRWLSGTSPFYASFNIQLASGSKEIEKAINQLPETDVDENTIAVLQESTGLRDMSVVKTEHGFGIHSINPIFWSSVLWSKVQLVRIDRMRASNEILAMKINQAINRKNGVNDAALDKQIEVYQDAIIKHTAKIKDIEAAYE